MLVLTWAIAKEAEGTHINFAGVGQIVVRVQPPGGQQPGAGRHQ
jgi:hypothetical protein